MAEISKTTGTKAAKSSSMLPGVDFDNLRVGMCKFPLGGIDDAPDRFCGEPAIEGGPYCPECAKKAYSRPERRR
jgi:hypothetical protein